MKNVFSSKSGSLLFLLCTISLFVGLYFNEDAGGGGTRYPTWSGRFGWLDGLQPRTDGV